MVGKVTFRRDIETINDEPQLVLKENKQTGSITGPYADNEVMWLVVQVICRECSLVTKCHPENISGMNSGYSLDKGLWIKGEVDCIDSRNCLL